MSNPNTATNAHDADTTIWTPPLSLKDQRRIDQQHKRQRYYFGFIARGGFKDKTLWDYLQLVAIPVIIGIGTLWFTYQQSLATAAASEEQYQTNLNIAQDQQQETALQTYLDRMSDLLFTEHLATSRPGDEVRQVARARTLTLLPQLNITRKEEVIRFLTEANLIQSNGKVSAIINLNGADLTDAYLSAADLHGADLSGADLSGAYLHGANLHDADLSVANLTDANLTDANLSGTDLRGAMTTPQQLTTAFSLSGTILPDGSKHL